MIQPIINLVTGNKKGPLSSLIDMSEVKFKEIDELTDIISSWSSKIKFEMEKHRD